MIDEIDWKILKELQTNARLSFADSVAHRLTTPAVIERVKKLERRASSPVTRRYRHGESRSADHGVYSR
jgi:hypothetical protein